ncbi:MAG TPA: RNA polymerase factor sigma-32 [Candidatus Azoamicus sp. OHIO1]
MNINLQFKTNQNLCIFYKKKYKILSPIEEYILANKLKNENDLTAAKTLIESNIYNVIKIAKNYSGYGLLLADLIQEGIIGLMKAVKRFDPDKKIRLITFAIYWIKSEIHEYIIKNIRIVKIANTKAQRKLFFNIKKIKNLGWLNNNEIKSISKTLNIKNKDIIYMEKRLSKNDMPFNTISYDEDQMETESNLIPENYINSNDKDPLILIEQANWKEYITNKLKIALYKLDTRSQEIIKARWLNKKKNTLKKLAQNYNISSERIRQLENNAIKKLKTLISTENKHQKY